MKQQLPIHLFFPMLVVLCFSSSSRGDDLDRGLLLLSTFDDTTDLNLFGAQHAGWIHTAESTRRAMVWVNNRCPEATIVKDIGKKGDCFKFAEPTKKVLYYQGTGSLPNPKKNWSGSLSIWLHPNLAMGRGDCYPIVFSDGDWNRGGFFIRVPAAEPNKIQLGAVSRATTVEPAKLTPEFDLAKVPKGRVFVTKPVTIKDDRWTLITMTYANINSETGDAATMQIFVNDESVGEIRKPISVAWMTPGATLKDDKEVEPEAAIFLGLNYVGELDDLRLYNHTMPAEDIRRLYKQAK